MKIHLNYKCNFNDYYQLGDIVDSSIVDTFLSVMPPVSWSNRIIQLACEPHRNYRGRPTYPTLHRMFDNWVYVGYCHKKGKIESEAV